MAGRPCAMLPAALTPEPLRLLLPSGPRRESRLPPVRRERYRAHLLQMIAEAHSIDPVIPPAARLAVNPAG